MATLGIPFFQINLHHSKSASAILARSMAVMQTHPALIALVQEPWIVKDGIRGLGGCGKIYCVRDKGKIRTCVIVKGVEATLLTEFSNGDMTALLVNVEKVSGGELGLIIGSVYMPYDSVSPPPQEELRQLAAFARSRGLEMLLGCDANSHHMVWGSTDNNPRGESLLDFVVGGGLHILNRGNEPTFMDSRRQEVIDITICTEGVVDLVRDWRVSNEPSGSDHRQIRYELRQVDVADTWTRNPRYTDWENYRTDLKERIQKIPMRFHNVEELETTASLLSGAIKDSYELNCQLKRKKLTVKTPWWNAELNELRTVTRRLFNKAKRHRSIEAWDKYKDAQRLYKKAIEKAKISSWRKFCESIESSAEASRLHKILCMDKNTNLGSLKLPDGTYTTTVEGAFRHLMESHFPGFGRSSPAERPKVPRGPKVWDLARKVVQPSGVEWAIKTFEPYKAPGPDGIYPVLLQRGISELLAPLTKTLRASIALRYVPSTWADTRVVFIPKPGRNGHVLAKDYRPISLTSFLLKTIERLVDRYIKSSSLRERPLADSQYAYREGRSTETALHHLVGGVETQLEAKGYAVGCFLDIEGAFDNTSNKAIREAMTSHGIPEPLIDWTESMLTSRNLTVGHGSSLIEGRPAGGCPQGGVLSPTLWCLVVDELLNRLEKEGFRVYGYADDVAVVIRGNFLKTLRDRMMKALEIIERWCEQKGLTINPTKTSVIIFTRKYKPEVVEPVRLWGKELAFVSRVKYLGVLIDTKLSWKQHLLESKRKFYITMWACRRAMGKTWGLKPGIAMWLYKAVLLPKLMYAAVVWWPRVEKVEARNLLRSLQGNYLRAVTGAMKTTPTEALEIALCIHPLDLTVYGSACSTAYRLKCQGEWRNNWLGHTRLKWLYSHPFTLEQDRIPRKYQIHKGFRTLIPSREDWLKPGQTTNPGVSCWFTDGSGLNDRFGAGVYGLSENYRESISLGSLATVFQAEVAAILRCADMLLSRGDKNKNIVICSDSRAAISALTKPTTESSVVWKGMLALEKLSKSNRVTLKWVPGHQNIHGNEVADSLARKGTSGQVSWTVELPFAIGRTTIKKKMEAEHLTRWTSCESCRWAKLTMKRPSTSRAKELLTMTRPRLRVAIGLLTGHATLKAHLRRMGITEDDICRLCGYSGEDSEHILCHCPALACKRYKLLGCAFMEPKELQQTKLSTLINLASDGRLGIRSQV